MSDTSSQPRERTTWPDGTKHPTLGCGGWNFIGRPSYELAEKFDGVKSSGLVCGTLYTSGIRICLCEDCARHAGFIW